MRKDWHNKGWSDGSDLYAGSAWAVALAQIALLINEFAFGQRKKKPGECRVSWMAES